MFADYFFLVLSFPLFWILSLIVLFFVWWYFLGGLDYLNHTFNLFLAYLLIFLSLLFFISIAFYVLYYLAFFILWTIS